MSSTVVVRPCEQADLAALRPHDPRPDASLPDSHFNDAQAGSYVFATAWIDDEPVGWGVLDLRDDELQPQLAHLWVFPEARRRGVGRAISTWIEDRAHSEGYTEMFLMVEPDNGKAVAMWLDLGYKPTGEHQVGQVVESGERTHQAIYRKPLRAGGR